MIIKIDSESHEVEGQVYIKTIPSLKLEIELSIPLSYPLLLAIYTGQKDFVVEIPGAEFSGEMNMVHARHGSNAANIVLSPARQCINVGNLDGAVEVRFHLLDFADFMSRDALIVKKRNGGLCRRERIVLRHDGYEIAISELKTPKSRH